MTPTQPPQRGERLKLAYLHGDELSCQPGEVLGPRHLSDFEIVYAIDGWINYESNGQIYTIAPGGCILGIPGSQEVYRWDPQLTSRHAYFHFDISQLPADWPDPSNWPRIRTALNPLSNQLLKYILQRIYSHENWPAEPPGISDCRAVELLLDLILCDAPAALKKVEKERPDPVQRALNLLRKVVEETPDRIVTLTDVAAAAHVSEKHLCRLFAQTVGHSPMRTFTLLKLQSSRPLLTRTTLSIKEISERCGFENPLYFSRCFSKTFGAPPSAFRDPTSSDLPLPMSNPLPADLMPRIRW